MRESASEPWVLLVDKPAGWTSHDVVAVARGALAATRIGHAGTLDPFATGLLVLGVGKATRILEYLVGLTKVYEARAFLGAATDTLDPEGERILEDDNWRNLGHDRLSGVLAGMTGRLMLTPPRYSAIKVGGVPAHRRVRRGETVELTSRDVTVHSTELLGVDLPEVRFRVECSSGTYVRSLAEEYGRRLGTAAHLTALRRTRVGDFRVDRASSIESLRAGQVTDRARVSVGESLSQLERVEVNRNEAAMLSTGRRIRTEARNGSPAAFFLPGDELVAIGAVRDGMLEPRKVFRRV
ncbi:MAG: tRNA pseudouridine(55) synthase TruB [Gemmatimonadetes bacterium]|nr:tRNA pseudouridine(55) synthase TruB [Gemmatimonadota bacterium]